MKKALLAVTALLIFVSNVNAESPTDKGVYSLSGSISYTNTNKDGGTMISITPAFMYFVHPNLAVGASIIYWDFKDDNFEDKTYGIGPVVRYYFGKDAIYPFASVEYTYTKDKFESSFSSTYTARGNDLTLGLGIDYFLSRNVALEPMIRYTFTHNDNNASSPFGTTSSSDRSETLFMGIGINAFIF
jgi:opacity protein-like surface antigen